MGSITTIKIISPKEIESVNSQEISVLLTFDDGYASDVELALPVLQEHGLERRLTLIYLFSNHYFIISNMIQILQ